MSLMRGLAYLHHAKEAAKAQWERFNEVHGAPLLDMRRMPRFSGNAHQRRVKRRAWLRSRPLFQIRMIDHLTKPATEIMEKLRRLARETALLVPAGYGSDLEIIEPERRGKGGR